MKRIDGLSALTISIFDSRKLFFLFFFSKTLLDCEIITNSRTNGAPVMDGGDVTQHSLFSHIRDLLPTLNVTLDIGCQAGAILSSIRHVFFA